MTERQKEITDSAIRLIDRSGIQNLTIKNLAGEMGITEPAIYRHFESKLAILCSILEEFSISTKNILKSGKNEFPDPLARMRHIFLGHIQIFTENPAVASVVFSEEIFQNEKVLSGLVFSIMKERIDKITCLARKGQKEGIIRGDVPAGHIAHVITGSLRMIVTEWRLSGRAFGLAESGESLWKSIQRLISP